ncbi:hypothetical protein LZK74_21495 (plasmid) [Sinorhizobium meliloti]|nr:hypothetical protein LZK74_21495 [Sinorhizobium meliloti]
MSEFPEGVMKLASEAVKENFESGEPWSKSIARAIMADRSARSTPSRSSEFPDHANSQRERQWNEQ